MRTPATPPADASPQILENKLAQVLKPLGRVITAYSGGIDSTVVAVVARRVLGKANAPAVIGDSATLPRAELDEARAIARQMDLELIEVAPDEQEDPNYVANGPDRCYHCKTHLYAALHKLAGQRGIPYIANGNNVDDLGDYRPGLEAAKEGQIVSPLMDAGFGKAQVRTLARHLNLPNADKPAAACLASRIPYGTPVTIQRLSQIEQAEAALHALGFTGLRVRHHETLARIELPVDQMPRMLDESIRQQIVTRLAAIGYLYIALDLAGYRTGSHNAVLKLPQTGR